MELRIHNDCGFRYGIFVRSDARKAVRVLSRNMHLQLPEPVRCTYSSGSEVSKGVGSRFRLGRSATL